MDRNETTLIDFLTEKIEKSGGSAQVKYLTHNLSNLSYEVRSAVASTQGELMKFLRKNSERFHVDANGNVRLQTGSTPSKNEGSETIREAYNPDKDLPPKIKDGEGIVIKIHPAFGFIAAKSPFKTTVYFTPSGYGDGQKTLFTDFETLFVGAKVCFNAQRSKGNSSSKYKATKWWFAITDKKKLENVNINDCQPNPRKSRDTGLYDPVMNEGEGSVFKLFPTFGFIAINGDTNNTVFFNKAHIANYENIVDLTKALKEGDVVEFKANRTDKKNIKARWCATQVWVKKSVKPKPVPKSTADHPVESVARQKRQYIKDVTGKIFPHAKGTVIKFGTNYEKLADADSSVFYMLGSKVADVSWEFTDGDNVHFDAVEIRSHPGWKATLVWTGDKPNIVLPCDMGDFSEFSESEVPDSRMSNNPVVTEISNRSFKKPFSKSSGYSSLRASEEEIYSKRPHSRGSSVEKQSYSEMDVEDISDTTSCYSRSSDIPPRRGRGNRGARQSRRRASYVRKKNVSQERKQVDGPKTNSYQGRRQDYGPRKNSHMDRRHVDVSKNPSTDSRSTHDKERFQRHMEFLNSYIEKSEDESEDKISPKSGTPDNQSLKSGSSKTGSRVSETVTHTNWADTPYPGESLGENDSSYMTSEDEGEKVPANLNSSEDEVEKLSVTGGTKRTKTGSSFSETVTYTNWADTPYSGEDEDLDAKSGCENSSEDKEEKFPVKQNSLEDEDEKFPVSQNSSEDEVEKLPVTQTVPSAQHSILPYKNSSGNKDVSENVSNCDDVYDSDDDFSETVDDFDKLLLNNNEKEEMSQSGDLTVENNEVKTIGTKAKVKLFKEIEGKITKVYCKYAEIANPLLPRSASFFWNDVYQHGVSISSKYDDLKEFMKVGDTFKFNCIEVIDDDGKSKLKCTLVWHGKKPKTVEITPEEYIDENKLSVTLNRASYEYYGKNDKPARTQPSASKEQDPEIPVPKFLVSVNSDHEEDKPKDTSDFAAASENLLVDNDDDRSAEVMERAMPHTSVGADKEQLIDGICKIIKYSGLTINLKADLNSISSEVLNFVLNSCAAKKHASSVAGSEKQTQTESDRITYTKPANLKKKGTEFTDTESQTIFTGEVIGKSTVTVMVNLTVQNDNLKAKMPYLD